MANTATIQFVSGVNSVTGSHFLLKDKEVLIGIDCGLLQGGKFAETENAKPFPYDVSKLQYLLITHAHIDHIGRIPKIVREGFRGEIISTAETKELAFLMLQDALGIMREEAHTEGREAAWDEEDMRKAFELWTTLSYRTPRTLAAGFSLTFKNAGHILGSAMCELTREGRTIVFTGDLGNTPTPLLPDTEAISGAHYLVMESVYGDRNHEGKEAAFTKLKHCIVRTITSGGTLLVPAFSLEKTQVLLHEINALVEEGEIEPVPVYLDSPLAEKITEVYHKRRKEFNKVAQSRIEGGDDPFSFPRLTIVKTVKESKAVTADAHPKVIIAGSGMSTGGRIIHHEKQFLPNPKTTILFIGYQVPGSLGRQIQDGTKEVMIDDKKISIRARVETIVGYSSHKDSDNLLSFVETGAETLEKVFVVLGEPKSALFLVQRIRDYLGIDAVHPREGEEVEIEI